jgi:hypothetical protein
MDLWDIGVKVVACLVFIGLERLSYKEHLETVSDYRSALMNAGVDPLKAACIANDGNAFAFGLFKSFLFIGASGLGQYIWRN